MSTKNYSDACIQYKYLLEKGYPEKASLKLVGDRHRLTRVERNCLFRGIIVQAAVEVRKTRIVQPADVEQSALGIDWYNALITVESYLQGTPVFIAEDGVARDSGARHGSYRPAPLTGRAMTEIVAAIDALAPARVDVFLDAPIAHSGLMAEDLRHQLSAGTRVVVVSVVPSADYFLKAYDGIVASSDSVIIDSARRIIDLPRLVLERAFSVTLPRVHELFAPAPERSPRLSGSEIPGP